MISYQLQIKRIVDAVTLCLKYLKNRKTFIEMSNYRKEKCPKKRCKCIMNDVNIIWIIYD